MLQHSVMDAEKLQVALGQLREELTSSLSKEAELSLSNQRVMLEQQMAEKIAEETTRLKISL